MAIESLAPQEEAQKEEALRKTKIFRMREKLQVEVMLLNGFDIHDPQKAKEALHAWTESSCAEEYKTAFKQALEEHPDLLETFEKSERQALVIVADAFNRLHHSKQ